MHTNRALLLAKTKQTRDFHLGSSINEFNYVIERAPKDFVLLPEILTKKGENLIRLGNAPLGVKELEEAIQLKADYWPPYTALSDYYKDRRDLPKAREVLKQALSFAPNAKPVQRRLAELNAIKHEPKQKR
jgi:Flp pilus assembly protein TadD